MTAVLSLADAQALAARATKRMNEYYDPSWPSHWLDRDRAAIASALRRMERHHALRESYWCNWCSENLCPDYLDATADLLRHCAPHVEVPS